MARETDLNINVTARDQASQVIRDVKDDVDDLEQADATVDVQADDNATPTLDKVDAGTRDLDGTKATVDVQADDNATRVIDDVQQDTRDLDGTKATVSVDVDDNATPKIDELQTKIRDLETSSARVRLGAGGAIAAGAAGGVAGGLLDDITGAISGAGDLALKTQQVADATGAPLDKASRLVTVWQQTGLEVEDLLDIIFQVNQVLNDQPELNQKLKIGGATDLIDRFLLAVKGVSTEYETAGSKAQAASQLFGEEGARQIGQVETRVGDLSEAMSKVSENQLIDPADVERSKELAQNIAEFNANLREAQLILAEDILPIVNTIADKIQGFAGAVQAAFNFISGPDISGGDIADRLFNGSRTSDGPTPPGQRGQGVFPSLPDLAPRGAASRGANATIIVNNPPGTAAQTVEADRIYHRRNDIRYS